MNNQRGVRRRPRSDMNAPVRALGTLAFIGLLAPVQAVAQVMQPPPRPLAFEANRGQTDEQVQFLAHGAGYTVFLTPTEAVLTLGGGRSERSIVRLKPVGANGAARIQGDAELPGVVNYSRSAPSAGHISAPTYGRVRYVDLYPGVDLVYYGGPRRLEYDFVVAPGADPEQIALAFDGVERVEVDAGGDLVAHTAAGELRQPRPVVYQEIDGARRRVAGDYLVDREGRVRVQLGAYDTSRPLVIDPVLAYSTYLGGTDDDTEVYFDGANSIAVDGSGNIYLAGTTRSADFPTTPGADQTFHGNLDVFVTKLSPTGALLYSTYLGGPCDDVARDIAVDTAGNAYITGRMHGGVCFADVKAGVLVAKLDPTGAVLYSSVFGGSLADSSVGQAIAVDAEGHAYVTGVANSDSHDFPTTAGAFRTGSCDNVYYFGGDGFVAKLSADGGTLLYSTFLCGRGDDSPDGIAVDAAGSAYVAGTTASSDFPTVNPLQDSFRGGSVSVTGFVSKLSPDGSRLVYSTYLGGSSNDAIDGIAIDGNGNAYVTGETDSQDFPTTPGVLQEHSGGRLCLEVLCTDAFVSKIDASGSSLVYSTYLYGELDDAGSAIAVDAAGNAYVVGMTSSSYFPIVDAFQTSNHGLSDAFVAKLNPDGTQLVYSSYLGGSRSGSSPSTGGDQGSGIALDAAGNAYVAGYTQSYDFPTTRDAFQPNLANGICDVFGTACGDAFVAKITAGGPGVVPPVNLTVTPTEVAAGGTLSALWAGIPIPTTDDTLQLYALGSSLTPFGELASWWPTTGTGGGNLSLLLPAGLPPGWYELRLLSPDPNFSNLPTVIARSEPIRVATPTTSQPTTTTTTPANTTTTEPCTTLRCSLDSVIASPACAGDAVPSSVTTKLDQATTLIEDAATSPAKEAKKLLKRAKKAVRLAKANTKRAAKGKKPKISSECAGVLKDAADRVLNAI